MSKRRRPGAGRRIAEQRFWGTPSPTGGPPADQATGTPANSPESGSVALIRPTADPAAVVRSLGPPPFAIDAAVVERHLTAVYEEAVRAATALAAANGLLAGDEDDEPGG